MSTHKDAAILLVEDDAIHRTVAESILRAYGYRNVAVAVNGEEAVRACTERTFDLILMDCEMPVMNGYDASRAIRALGVRTPIVAFTASVTPDNKARCSEAGMDDFLPKPAPPGHLAQKIGQWLP
jgi:CheY-like chemotaxis protein